MKTEFYKMEYEAWDEGTDYLTLEQEGAYLRLCHQMYRRRGPVPNNPSTLARLWRCHTNKAKVIIDALIKLGKVQETADGFLTNSRVELELNRRGVSTKPQGNPDQTQSKPNGNPHPTPSQPGEGLSDNSLISLTSDDSENAYKSREDKSREDSIADAFERFWKAYPKRKGGNPRHPARLKFFLAVKGGTDPEAIIRGVKQYAAELERNGKLGSEYVKQGQYWLNQRQWEDYNAVEDAIKQIREKVKVFKGTSQWDAWVKSGHNPNLHTEILDPTTGRRRDGWYFVAELPPDVKVAA